MEAEQFRRISKALADPRRYELLKRIASCDEAACLALRPEIPVSAATLSHHVKMRHFGFKSDKKGQKHGQATGKVAVVTGASKGIGAAIAEKLGSEGANVIVNYSTDRVGAEKVAQKINASGAKATVIKANLARPQEVKLLFAETKRHLAKSTFL